MLLNCLKNDSWKVPEDVEHGFECIKASGDQQLPESSGFFEIVAWMTRTIRNMVFVKIGHFPAASGVNSSLVVSALSALWCQRRQFCFDWFYTFRAMGASNVNFSLFLISALSRVVLELKQSSQMAKGT